MRDGETKRADGMTHVSGEAFDKIVYGHMTPAEAARYLMCEKPTVKRGVGETLRLMYGGTDLKGDIKRFFLSLDPSLNPKSVDKKIANWLSGRNVPERESLFKIAFATGLSESQLDYLLSVADGCGIRYRDAGEMAKAWHLREGLPYEDAVAFVESLPPCGGREVSSPEHTHLTQKIANESRVVHTTEELRSVCERNAADFGSHHLRAHYYFDRFMEKLVQPDSWSDRAEGKAASGGRRASDKAGGNNGLGPLPDEDRYSIESVMKNYLALGMPSSKSRKNLTPVLKLLKDNWPNLTFLKEVRNHEKDVPRKLLLLLYVVTEYAGIDEDSDDRLACDETLEERVRDHMVIIDALMDDCGMARLDMRNAFDWLVMYSVAVEDDDDVPIEEYKGMSDRMEEVIGEMFPDAGK